MWQKTEKAVKTESTSKIKDLTPNILFLAYQKKTFSYNTKNFNPCTCCSNGSNSGNNLDLYQQTQIGRIKGISVVNFCPNYL